MPFTNHTKDLVDGVVGGERTVEDGKLTLETLWDVIASSSGLNHGCHKLGKTNVLYDYECNIVLFFSVQVRLILHSPSFA